MGGRGYTLAQVFLAAVGRIEVVVVQRHVALGGHGGGGGRQPDHREPQVGETLGLGQEVLPPVLLVGLPVEGLQPKRQCRAKRNGTVEAKRHCRGKSAAKTALSRQNCSQIGTVEPSGDSWRASMAPNQVVGDAVREATLRMLGSQPPDWEALNEMGDATRGKEMRGMHGRGGGQW